MKVNINLSTVKQETNQERTDDDEEISRLDRRLQRLQRLRDDSESKPTTSIDQLNRRRRRRFEPEVIEEQPDTEPNDENDVEDRHASLRERLTKEKEESEEEETDKASNQHAQKSHQVKEVSTEEESEEELSDEESSDDESEEDEFFNSAPRIKPIFVSKANRHSIIDHQKEAEERAKQDELKSRKAAEERRKEALRMIESTVQREQIENEQSDANFESINSVKTDDESDEVAFLNWKLRELKRNRRDKAEREAIETMKEEVERMRNMSEEERIDFLKKNPKMITNEREKGKYRFLQKYYHRGAFFMDEEESVYKRDVAKPTLEDHFDKSVLPKVMQVKNFGRSGQTKYTHLVDQDTTDQSSPWYSKDQTSAKTFYEKHGGGMKQVFDRPSKKRKN